MKNVSLCDQKRKSVDIITIDLFFNAMKSLLETLETLDVEVFS